MVLSALILITGIERLKTAAALLPGAVGLLLVCWFLVSLWETDHRFTWSVWYSLLCFVSTVLNLFFLFFVLLNVTSNPKEGLSVSLCMVS